MVPKGDESKMDMPSIHHDRPAGTTLGIIMRYAWRLCVFFALSFGAAAGANRVNIDVVKAGESTPVDTLYADSAYEIGIWIENDFTIGAMSLGTRIWSPDGVTWQWEDVGGAGSITHCITVVPGSRLSGDAFDWQGLLAVEYDVDGSQSDTIMCGGGALWEGIKPGPLQHMYSYHFTPDVPTMYNLFTLCIDSCFCPPAGDFIFTDGNRCASPEALWPYGGRCFVVTDEWTMPSYCDPAFPVCPGGDAPFHVYLRDDFGDPIVGESNVWVEFVNCDQIQPCPESPPFTTIYPVAPSDADGMLSFYMAGGGCDGNGYAVVKTTAYTIGMVPVRTYDITGDFVVSIKNDWDPFNPTCCDFNGDGVINFNDDNLFQAHVSHSCILDPCRMFGYEFTLDPESNLMPGQTITLKLALANNNVSSDCSVGIIGFYSSPFGAGMDEELIENVPFNTTLGPGDEELITLPYTIPVTGHGCVHARFTTDCCGEMIELTRCFQSFLHCKPDSNVCYDMHIQLDDVPVYDTVWHQYVPAGWSIYPLYVPAFPLYAPDSLTFRICTPDLSSLGDSAAVVFCACFDAECTDFQQFENRVVITSQTGDANNDCMVNVGDAVYLINYIFKYGRPPAPMEAGDTNCDGAVNVGDVVTIINFVFKGGRPPCLAE